MEKLLAPAVGLVGIIEPIFLEQRTMSLLVEGLLKNESRNERDRYPLWPTAALAMPARPSSDIRASGGAVTCPNAARLAADQLRISVSDQGFARIGCCAFA